MDQTNTNPVHPVQTPVTETNAQVASVAQNQPQIQNKSGNGWKIVGCALGVIAITCITFFLGAVGLGVYGIQLAKESLNKELDTKVCISDDAAMRRVYKENTTSSLKMELSEAEFVQNVKKLSSDCNSIKTTPPIDTLGKSWNISLSNDIDSSVILFKGKVGQYHTTIELVSKSGGEYLINKFEVK